MKVKCPRCGQETPARFCETCGIRFAPKKKSILPTLIGVSATVILLPLVVALVVSYARASDRIEVYNRKVESSLPKSSVSADVENTSIYNFNNFRAEVEVLDFSKTRFPSDKPEIVSVIKCESPERLMRNDLAQVKCEVPNPLNLNTQYQIKFYDGDLRVSVGSEVRANL